MDASSGDKPTVAEAYLSALKKHGVDVVFANGGTDFAPIVEGLLRAGERGSPLPRFVTVPHENVAVSMASGYYKVSGRPAAVMVHTTVGTANALCGIMNADRGNVPLLLAAGRSPWSERGHPGSRNIGIHWSQENFDQGGMVRQYTRWDYELRAGQPAQQDGQNQEGRAVLEELGDIAPDDVFLHDSSGRGRRSDRNQLAQPTTMLGLRLDGG